MSEAFQTLNLEAGDRQAFASIGRCIYCGAKDPDLSDEHIIPHSLTGNAVVFKRAVCETCRKTTHAYEARVLQRMYGNLRIQMDTPTRRPAERSSILKHTFLLLDEEMNVVGERTIERPWNRSPVACPGWHSDPPGFLEGRTKSSEVWGKKWAYLDEAAAAKFIDQARSEIGHDGPIAYRVGDVLPVDYHRFIAKVVHGYAVALFGYEAFEHWLVPIILCKDDAVSHLVGGYPNIEPGVPNGSTVKIDFGHPTNGLPILISQIQLFEFLGTPEHLVVVGAAPAMELPRRLPLDRHGKPQ